MARRRLFEAEPISELRGLTSLTDPDRIGGVIDVAVFGARGDGKTQFIVHAIRTLRAHAPELDEAERLLNREVLRVVLDPRAPRPEATPPGFVPHYTFRVRPHSVLSRLRALPAVRLLWRATPRRVTLAALAFAACLGFLGALGQSPTLREAGLALAFGGAAILAALAAGRALRRAPELEVAFWDIAGEHVYSASAADYYSLLSALIAARKQRAAELGRPYAFLPVLLCNPLALGTRESSSPFERLRQLLPLFAAIDERGGRALVAINRWSIVDPICAHGALRDEVIAVSAAAIGEAPGEPRSVARDLVRKHCLDLEEGRDGDVTLSILRYDTALCATVTADARDAGATSAEAAKSAEISDAQDAAASEPESLADARALCYRYDEGPGAFSGEAASAFLDWLLRGLRPVEAERGDEAAGADRITEAAPRPGPPAAPPHESWPRRPSSEIRTPSAPAPLALPPLGPALDGPPPLARAAASEPVPAEVWARPADSGTLPGGLAGGGGAGGLR